MPESHLVGVIRWGGIPVLYVAAWSSETEIVIRRDSLIGGKPAVFRAGSRGVGKPIFGKMDESRVRSVLTAKRCQVCAGRLGAESYVLDTPFGISGKAPIMNEPLACRPCFVLSLALCPGIARQRAKPRAFAARVRKYDCIVSFLRPVDGGDAELNRALAAWPGPAPVGYLRPALVDYDVVDIAELSPETINA